MFGDYMNPDAEPDERVYDEIRSLDDMYAIVEQCLEEYNNTHKNRMNLVIFRWVLGKIYMHLCVSVCFFLHTFSFVSRKNIWVAHRLFSFFCLDNQW